MAIRDSLRNLLDREKSKFVESPTRAGEAVPEVKVGNTNSDPVPVEITNGSDTTATIYNVAVTTADTEESQALPASTKEFIIKARGKSTIKLAYTIGESGTDYITIPAGAVFTDKNLYTSQTLYFQTSKDGETVEIIAYT